MSLLPVPSQSGVQTALRSFLVSVLPSTVEVIEGQDNRVAEPSGTDFIVMTTIRRERIATNVDTYADCRFIGSVSGSTLTVSAVSFGTVTVGNLLLGTGVAAGTAIASAGSGTGGAGTYTLSAEQTLGSQVLASGVELITQPTRLTVQLDVHSANVGDAADMAETISTLFRDDYAVQFFKTASPAVSPLYADDPKQVPFLNAEQQYETRYVVEAVLQANQVLTPSQQFMDDVVIDIIDASNAYPA